MTRQQLVCPPFASMSVACKKSIFGNLEQPYDLRLFASREQQIKFIELHEN